MLPELIELPITSNIIKFQGKKPGINMDFREHVYFRLMTF
ncbi:hypothetical protein AM1_C0189 (plasmid) [Acaryochloris marina MBIC11017]|uniref:Uncharacterized protein n=1 Tax=Acaryochloris marina (strain MBIC 11017) TaxID=329726 RepID=A8ZMS9_ACAM1|nr:hypothetical protein AM1_C0189 [Acaryochloris marina MBIC11017]